MADRSGLARGRLPRSPARPGLVECRPDPVERQRQADKTQVAAGLCLNHAERLGLRVGDDLVQGVDRPVRDAPGVKQPRPPRPLLWPSNSARREERQRDSLPRSRPQAQDPEYPAPGRLRSSGRAPDYAARSVARDTVRTEAPRFDHLKYLTIQDSPMSRSIALRSMLATIVSPTTVDSN
jgi:hypothetical protein